MGFLQNIFSSEKRHYAEAEKLQAKVLALESEYAALSDEELQAKTPWLKGRLAKGESLNDILPDAFATAREAAKRVIGEFPYPVQVLGGVLLHDGDIAEMKTGEGKTLTAVMPIYLNALEGKGAHVVTVNEYLAARDAEWMGGIYRFLGLTVGCNSHSLISPQKQAAYACDITYTTNSELGFDYLRDNMVMDVRQRVLRGLHYAVLDEVDSILIDESRTPLIISGPGPVLDQNYLSADGFAKSCKLDTDVVVSREDNAVTLTEEGIRKAEKYFHIDNFYNTEYADLVHYIQNALRANFIMKRDVEYVVGDDEIILVDQFTGRRMQGREFSDGLHQAIQAKEGVGIKAETQTLATITYQNFFRLYDKLSGMTGTAKTEEDEFLETYNMRVYVIPTNRPVQRVDEKDAVFRTRAEKYAAIVEETKRLHEKGQPVLVGTVSVGINELLSRMLKEAGVPHEVLNAKNDADEAGIIARAGLRGAVTVATNMAGRGTDIKLGEGVAELGGLAVLGSERHEAKRIDNQLRGRSGRQGDPGFSRFYCSMDDDLMVQYTTEETKDTIEAYKNGKVSDDKMRQIIDATQARAEGLHFDARSHTLEFDNVLMQQRHFIYEQRDKVLMLDDTTELVKEQIESRIQLAINAYENTPDRERAAENLRSVIMSLHLDPEKSYGSTKKALAKNLTDEVLSVYNERMKDADPAYRTHMEKVIFLSSLDMLWIRHVDVMEHMKHSIQLRGYANVKPIDAYTEEGNERFENMLNSVTENAVAGWMRMSRQALMHGQEESEETENTEE